MTNLTYISFLRIYFSSLHVSSNPVLIIRRINCINTTSGICHSVSVTVSCAGRKGIWEVYSFNLRRDADHHHRCCRFMSFQALKNAEILLLVGHDRFPPYRTRSVVRNYCHVSFAAVQAVHLATRARQAFNMILV
jgi:hypothetical protein